MFSTLLVADTLMEIFKDNRVLLEQLNEKVLRCFVGHPPGSTDSVASAGHNARYLDFLGHLCVCDGVGIPTNQVCTAHAVHPKALCTCCPLPLVLPFWPCSCLSPLPRCQPLPLVSSVLP